MLGHSLKVTKRIHILKVTKNSQNVSKISSYTVLLVFYKSGKNFMREGGPGNIVIGYGLDY